MTDDIKAAVAAGARVAAAPDALLLADRIARLRMAAVEQVTELDGTLASLDPFLPDRFDALRVDTWQQGRHVGTRWHGADGFRAWVHAYALDESPHIAPTFAQETR